MSHLAELRTEFIRSWGEMGTCWGINRTMAQIHALLMISTRPLSTDDVMRELKISRGNASMNLRELISWGLVRRHIEIGDRKEYFVSVNEVAEIFCNIVRERKKREIEPVIQSLERCTREASKLRPDEGEIAVFRRRTGELLDFMRLANQAMERLSRQADGRVFRTMLRALA
ncbi:MAG TPA: MarR family transcriptional regulator [Verrucomicrobiae bacterium]|nr:MarR family transcriptional regulator [Verrucomicrobiae bacterium]